MFDSGECFQILAAVAASLGQVLNFLDMYTPRQLFNPSSQERNPAISELGNETGNGAVVNEVRI